MSTATLRFQLPEEEHEFRRAMLGDLAIQTLWHVDQHCRGAIKHGDVSQETASNVAADSRNDPRRA
jgi:hypothetical protein